MAGPIGWGVVGLGAHFERRMAAAFGNAARSRLVAVCSRSPERARRIANRYAGVRAYGALHEMLRDPALDALYIATPNSLHAPQAIEAARSGKHVLCEKPLALLESDCEAMIRTCDEHRVKLGVVLQNRYHPAHVEARRLVATGALGPVAVARAQYGHLRLRGGLRDGWRGDPAIAGAGALLGTGLHPIDLLRFLLGSEVVEVRAWCDRGQSQVDEIVHVILAFSSGTSATVTTGVIPFSDDDVVLYGERAKLACRGTVGMSQQGELQVEGAIQVRRSFPTENPDWENYRRVIDAFDRCVLENTPPPAPGHEGLMLCRIANAVLESCRLGRASKIA